MYRHAFLLSKKLQALSRPNVSGSRVCCIARMNGHSLFLLPQCPVMCARFLSSPGSIEKRQLTERDVTLGVDLGVAQSLFSDSFGFLVEESQTMERIQQSRHYMKTQTGHLKPEIVELCRNEHDKCTLWAVAGECETNPKYMKKSCAPACLSCDYLSIEGRCPIDPNAPQAWGPGDLNAMFTKLTSEPYLSNYSVQILSSPTTTGGPWLITMDNVLSEAESERLIQLGTYLFLFCLLVKTGCFGKRHYLTPWASCCRLIHHHHHHHHHYPQAPKKAMNDRLMSDECDPMERTSPMSIMDEPQPMLGVNTPVIKMNKR